MTMHAPTGSFLVLRVGGSLVLTGLLPGFGEERDGKTAPTSAVVETKVASESPLFAARDTARPTFYSSTPRQRAVSPQVAAEIASLLPPTPAVPAKSAPASTVPIAPPETSEDNDGIVRMPRYIVRDEKVPAPPEEKVLTKRGVAGVAMKRYLTETYRVLNPVTLPLFGMPPEARATAMYREDERLRRIEDFKDQVRMMNLTDKAAAQKIRRESDKLLMRDPQFGR